MSTVVGVILTGTAPLNRFTGDTGRLFPVKWLFQRCAPQQPAQGPRCWASLGVTVVACQVPKILIGFLAASAAYWQ